MFSKKLPAPACTLEHLPEFIAGASVTPSPQQCHSAAEIEVVAGFEVVIEEEEAFQGEVNPSLGTISEKFHHD